MFVPYRRIRVLLYAGLVLLRWLVHFDDAIRLKAALSCAQLHGPDYFDKEPFTARYVVSQVVWCGSVSIRHAVVM